MFDSSKVWLLLASSRLVSGARVHRAALRALAERDWGAAERLCELAAMGYRRSLSCEPLARVRVHQCIARAHASHLRSEVMELEIENALARLDRIEALAPPHELVDARRLMGQWMARSAVLPPQSAAERRQLAA